MRSLEVAVFDVEIDSFLLWFSYCVSDTVLLSSTSSTVTKQTIPNILPSVRQGVHSKMSALSVAIELNAEVFYFLNGEFHIIILGHVEKLTNNAFVRNT